MFSNAVLADYIDMTVTQFNADLAPAPDNVKAAGFLMLGMLLTTMGLKQRTEPIKAAVDRLRASENPEWDLLNPEHRLFVGAVLRQMFEPLGADRVVMIAVTPEARGFIAQITKPGSEILDMNAFLKWLGDGVDLQDDFIL